MSGKTLSDSTLATWYRDRIGEPRSGGEVLGYWLFAVGVLLGVVGLVLVAASQSATTVRQAGIALAALGLVLLVVGPIVRLPVAGRAATLAFVGSAICLAAIAWFLVAYPSNWSPATGNAALVGLYAAGLLVVAIGGVVVPILPVGPSVAEREATARERAATADERTDLRDALADAEADEADLAAELRSLRQSQARFELYADRGGEWRWRLRHRNGNVVATAGEGYTRRHNAQKGLASVRRNALGATVLDLREAAALPEADEPFEPVEAAESQATFDLYGDSAGEYRWRLVHDNGNVLADGGEGYATRDGARTAIDRTRGYVGPADYLRADPTAFEVYRDLAGEWRWRLVHRNGNVLADGGEGYASRSNARRAVDRLRDAAGEMADEVYEDEAGEYRWRLRSGGDVVADSGEGYESRDGAEDALARVREHAPGADALEIGEAAVEVYEDSGGEWRWRLRHRNGNVLADSGEGYESRSDVHEAVERVKRHAPNAPTEEQD